MGYVFWPLVIILVLPYLISYILAKKEIFSLTTHKKIWNSLLLTSFLICGGLGFLLVLQINFGLYIPFQFNMLFYHVEAGIALFLIAVFHILWHAYYFR